MQEIQDKNRWIGGALIASLALNLFMGGFLVARLISGERQQSAMSPVEIDFRTLPRGLPPSIREDIEHHVRERKREITHTYRELIQARATLGKLMIQENLDKGALEKEFGKLRDLQIELQSPLHEAMIEALGTLNPEQRREIVFVDQSGTPRRLWMPGRVDGQRWEFRSEDGRFTFDFRKKDNDTENPDDNDDR